MPNSRTLAVCVAISVLLHVAGFFLSLFLPWGPPPSEEVVTVALADMPRSPDFLPPKAGILRGGRPKVPPPQKERAPRREEPAIPPKAMEGRVPDLPVDPSLPPEKEFSAPKPKEEVRQKREEAAQAAKAEKPSGARANESAPRAAGGTKSLRDLTPSLGKMVMARNEPGGRGLETSAGGAVGTGGKAKERGEITEERGGGTRLTALNAPEIQYISYFAAIKRKIELVWQYPYDAATAGIQGELVIDFVIGRSGKLESATLVNTSGHRVLDDEAMRSVRTAAPFDPIPAEYRIPNLQIRAHFVYEMHALKLR